MFRYVTLVFRCMKHVWRKLVGHQQRHTEPIGVCIHPHVVIVCWLSPQKTNWIVICNVGQTCICIAFNCLGGHESISGSNNVDPTTIPLHVNTKIYTGTSQYNLSEWHTSSVCISRQIHPNTKYFDSFLLRCPSKRVELQSGQEQRANQRCYQNKAEQFARTEGGVREGFAGNENHSAGSSAGKSEENGRDSWAWEYPDHTEFIVCWTRSAVSGCGLCHCAGAIYVVNWTVGICRTDWLGK